MRKIYRTQIAVDEPQTFNIDGYRKALAVAQARNGVYGIDVWYLVGALPTPTKVTFSVAGTGHPLTEIETEKTYVGTCVMSDGLVWHVFAEEAS